ncbi:hypothetical protein CRG98_035766 [Punica granatum]|uniref:Uncharacterized protein n=1 Tax=Punica granatum TaxID=22663 RepID=A0A2I0IIY0_PUNGR|nr:hypothetical protein CRG98_035766 [Punica granatum]
MAKFSSTLVIFMAALLLLASWSPLADGREVYGEKYATLKQECKTVSECGLHCLHFGCIPKACADGLCSCTCHG